MKIAVVVCFNTLNLSLVEKTEKVNRFSSDLNQEAMTSSESCPFGGTSSDEEFVEMGHYLLENRQSRGIFQNNVNNLASNPGERNRAAQVRNSKLTAATADEIMSHHGRNENLDPSLSEGISTYWRKESGGFNSNTESDVGVVQQGAILFNAGRNGKYFRKNTTGVELSLEDDLIGHNIIPGEMPKAMKNLQNKCPSNFDQSSKVAMDLSKLRLKLDTEQAEKTQMNRETASSGYQMNQDTSSAGYQMNPEPISGGLLGHLVKVVAKATGSHDTLYRNKYPVRDGAMIGRTSECDVVVSSKTVSRTQAKIYREGKEILYQNKNNVYFSKTPKEKPDL